MKRRMISRMKNIAVTGYYGTGSSAVVDLLSEVQGTKCALGIRYEHTNLNCAGGIFDLEARLFHDNADYYSKDIALNDFYNEMLKQYKYNFGWYGSYKKMIGEKYLDSVNELMDTISLTGNKNSLAHTTKKRFSIIKAALQIAAKLVFHRKYGVLGCKYVYDKDPQRFLTASYDEFMIAARKFVKSYLDFCQIDECDMIYDHLLYPEQSNVVERYFDDNFRLIIVDRDPRDIYISDKYFWSTAKFGYQTMPMPTEIDSFCDYCLSMHERAAKQYGQKNILFVRFEDLIYKYEETVKKIFDFCEIDSERHVDKKKVFKPELSINNTQVFNLIDDAKDICERIKNKLPNLIYDFPYVYNGNEKSVFDA